jgi:type VI secretion system protein VasD
MSNGSTMNQYGAREDDFNGQRRALLLAGLGLTLAGCASAPKPPDPLEPANLVITVLAHPDVNPDIRGRASPLSLRLFELKSGATFQTADFFALYDRDQATLGADLFGREELIVKPGETQTVTRKANPETRLLGVVAAFRDLEHSVWRVAVAVAPPAPVNRNSGAGAREQRISVVCERASVRIE